MASSFALMIPSMKEKIVELFTDGACRGNPGPGGWGVLLRYNGIEKVLSGGETNTTNNRMELMAAIQGLNALKKPCRVDLFTDSEYVQKGMTQWINKWRLNNWKTSDGKPIKNLDLWQELDAAVKRHQVRWHWVRGHSGHPENERADELARFAIDELMVENGKRIDVQNVENSKNIENGEKK